MDVEQGHIDDEDGGFNGAASVDDDDVSKEEETETEKVAARRWKTSKLLKQKEKEEKGRILRRNGNEDKAGATGYRHGRDGKNWIIQVDGPGWSQMRSVWYDDREDEVLLCGGCDNGFHIFCLKPALKKIPDDEWFWEMSAALEPTDGGDSMRDRRVQLRWVPARVVAPPPFTVRRWRYGIGYGRQAEGGEKVCR